jgi:hypothetical protein
MSHWYGSNFSSLENTYRTSNIPPTVWACFGGVYKYYVKGKPFYVGQVIDREIVEKFAEEFNSIYKNINMRVVSSCKYYKIRNTFYGSETFSQYKATEEYIKRSTDTFDFTVWTLDFVTGYEEIVKYDFFVIVGELLRVYNKHYDFVIRGFTKDIKSNYFTNAVNLSFQYKKSCGGNAFYIGGNINHILLFDDIEKINEILKEGEYTINHKDYWVARAINNFTKMPAPTQTLLIIQKALGEEKEENKKSQEQQDMLLGLYKNKPRNYQRAVAERIYYRDGNGRFISRRQYERLHPTT